MKYKTVPGVITTSVCDTYFLVTADMTIRINESAAFYLKKLEEGADEDELTAFAKERYEIEDENDLRAGIRELIKSLLEKRLLLRYFK